MCYLSAEVLLPGRGQEETDGILLLLGLQEHEEVSWSAIRGGWWLVWIPPKPPPTKKEKKIGPFVVKI